MLVAIIAGAVVCGVSLTAGLAVRTRLARSPMAGVPVAGPGPAGMGPPSVEPASVEPASAEPASVEPASVESASVESASVEPAGVEPADLAAANRWAPLGRVLLRPDAGVAGLAVWLMLLDALLALVAPWPLILVVDYALGHHPYPHWLAGLPGLPPVQIAVVAAAAGLAVLAMGSVAGYLVTFLVGTLGERMSARLRAGLVAHVLRAAPRDVTKFALGELTSRVGADAARVSDTVTEIVDTLIPDTAVLAGMTVLTALLDWRLTLVVLGVIPLY